MKFSTILLFFIALTVYSQDIDFDKFKKLSPRNIGPAGMSGRVTAIDVNRLNKQEIYCGTASGGLWKSTSGGITWFPIFDSVEVQSIGAFKIQQSNPDVLWVGTGEGNPRNSLNSGKGIYKSIDGGKTWQFKGLKNSSNIHRIIINRENPDIVFAGVIGNPWYNSEERGIFKTTNGGDTWEKILYINDLTGCSDLVVDPINPNKMIATMWEHQRKPYFFNSGGKGSGIYITYDAGKNWKKVTDGLPEGTLGRIGLAIATNRNNIVYAIVEAKKNGFYKSEDGGESWKLMTTSNFGNRPFYYSEIYVDPQNENRIYSLYSVISRSEDGGKTWEVIVPYSGVHPDHHAFWIDPENPKFMIDGNDGGLNITWDMGESWRFIENIPVAQFYHISVDNAIPYNIYGGMQDNGSWIGPSRVWRQGGIRNSYWQELTFGDGFDVVPDASNPRYGYSMYQEGNLMRYDLETGKTNFIKPTQFNDVPLRFNWNAAISQDPYDNKTVYYGSQFVHKSTNYGNDWEAISPDLTTNDTTKQNQRESGGLTYDVTGAENHTTILSISPSKIKKDLIWVSTDDGNIQVTTDGGKNWTNTIKNIPNYPKTPWVPYLLPSIYNENEAFAIVNNYRQGDMNAYLFHTKDLGKSWTNIVAGKNIDSYTLSFWQDVKSPNLYFLGTENGLFLSFDAGKTWKKWKVGYPACPTMDMAYNSDYNDLVLGTYGRAAWVFDNIAPFQEIAKDNSILSKKIHSFETQGAYLVSWRRSTGARFDADATFKGANISSNARIQFYVNSPDKNKNTDKKSKEKTELDDEDNEVNVKDDKEENEEFELKENQVRLIVYDLAWNPIRELRQNVEDGLNIIEWGLDAKKIRYPNQKKATKFVEYGGHPIQPGKYNLILEYQGDFDTNSVEVIYDLRSEFDLNVFNSQQAKLQELYKLIETTTEIADRFREVKESISIIEKNYSKSDKEVIKKVKELNDSLGEKIDEVQEILFGKKKDKQGIFRRPDILNGNLSSAEYYINSSDYKPGSNIENLMKKCRTQLDTLIEDSNKFFEKDWVEYQSKIESLDNQIFKNYKKIEK
jgi:photosystem II stability/assembly factor-like uncharacterized protein